MAINGRTTAKPGHKRYEELAEEIARQIAANVLRPGDRLPSIRQTCRTRHLSPSTVFQAYALLENQGLVRAAPRSGYFVNPPPSAQAPEPAMSTPPEGAHPVEITDLVGWVAAGRFANSVRRLKLMTSLSGSVPAQATLAEYLQQGGYDRHLRQQRAALKRQKEALIESVTRHFPRDVRLTRPEGGYFMWVDLPWDTVDAVIVYRRALANQISIAPGPMFSNHGGFRNCLRLNFGYPWTPQAEQAIATLGRIIRGQLDRL